MPSPQMSEYTHSHALFYGNFTRCNDFVLYILSNPDPSVVVEITQAETSTRPRPEGVETETRPRLALLKFI